MENINKDNLKSLFLIFILEFIIALNISFFAYGTIIRIIEIVLMLISLALYFSDVRKLNSTSIIFLAFSLLYGVSVLPNLIIHYTTNDVISIIDIIPAVLSFLGASWIGYILGIDKESNIGKYLIAIYGALFVFGVVSLLATLFSYGLLYMLEENIGSVMLSSKMWIIGTNPFQKETRVYMTFFGYTLSLLSSGFMVLWQYKKVDDSELRLKKIALASGILGVAGLILIPYFLGIFVSVLSMLITALIMNFPKDKNKRKNIILGIGLFALFAIVLVAWKGKSIARVEVGINVLKNVLKYPLGNQPKEVLKETMNTRNIYLDALFQNGIPAFLILVGLTIVTILTIYKYYKNSNDTSLKKNLILSFMVHYYVYVNLNYGQNVFVEYADTLPLYLDPTLLIVLLLVGYMMADNNKTSKKPLTNGISEFSNSKEK